ncbi:MAG TPA: hypothetical protein VGD98_09775 [Ktedonobacteraceae bacterium]
MTLEALAEIAEFSPKTVSAAIGSKTAILAEPVNPDTFEAPMRDFLSQLLQPLNGWGCKTFNISCFCLFIPTDT